MCHAYYHDWQLLAGAYLELRTTLNASPPPNPLAVLLTVSIFPDEETVPGELKCPGLNFQATKTVILGTELRLSESYPVFLDSKVNRKDGV